MRARVIEYAEDGSSIVRLFAETEDGTHIVVAADWRPAVAIMEALEDPEADEDIEIDVGTWQIMGSW